MKQIFDIGDLVQLKSYDEVLQCANICWPTDVGEYNESYVREIFSRLGTDVYEISKISMSKAGTKDLYEIRLKNNEDINERIFQDYFIPANQKENNNIKPIFGQMSYE